DLGDRGDRGARVAAGGLLLDRDRGAEAVDVLDVRLLHHLEELARVGAEALDVAALAFGVDRVEREAAFARARQPGDHDQRVARQIDVDALEVVLAGAAHGYVGETHRFRMFRKCSLWSRGGRRSLTARAMWGGGTADATAYAAAG